MRNPNYKLGFVFATFEHIFEGITNLFLVGSVIVAYFYQKFAFVAIVITTIIHFIARFCHRMERKCFKGKF